MKQPILHSACENGFIDAIKQLLLENVNVNAKGGEAENTALMIASRLGHLEIVKLLIDHGCNVLACNKYGMTAFGFAALRKQYNIIKYIYHHLVSCRKYNKSMIQSHVDQPESKTGHTAYMLACKTGHQKTIDVLIKYCHVDVTKRDKYGRYGSDLVDVRSVKLRNWLKSQESQKTI